MTPSWLHIDFASEVADAIKGKWEGVVINVTSSSNPKNHDWTPFSEAVTAAAKAGLRIHVRLPVAGASAHSADSSPSWWAVNYNGGKAWNQPYRLPLAVARAYAEIYLSKAIKIAVEICKAYNLSVDHLTFETGNEAGVGGANCACLGFWSKLGPIYDQFKAAWARFQKSKLQADYLAAKKIYLQVFPASMWDSLGPTQEGVIEPYFWTMLRAELELLDFGPYRNFGYTCEGAVGSVGQREIDSYAGIDAQWISDKIGGRGGFNRYMNTPCSTTVFCGAVFSDTEKYQIARMRKNPRYHGELFNTEFGMRNKKTLITGTYDIAEGRQAVLMAQRALSNVVGAGWYRNKADDPMSSGNGNYLENADGSHVGKFLVRPGHV